MKEDIEEQKSINMLLEKILCFEINPLRPEDLTDILKITKAIAEYRNRKLNDAKQRFEEHIERLKDDGYVLDWHYNGCYVVRFGSHIHMNDIVKATDEENYPDDTFRNKFRKAIHNKGVKSETDTEKKR